MQPLRGIDPAFKMGKEGVQEGVLDGSPIRCGDQVALRDVGGLLLPWTST